MGEFKSNGTPAYGMTSTRVGRSMRGVMGGWSVRGLIACVSWGACAGLAGGAQAAVEADAATDKLEEVVVTARKQTENLQDIPVTVTALTAKTLEQLQVKSIFDLSTVTPGLYFGTSGGRNGGNKLQIRNFSSGTAGPSKASVFIDGVYSAGDYASIPLANLERVEVLKGPQSAYFGRATFVGAVNFITRDPGNEFTGKFDVLGATDSEYDATGFVSIPIVHDMLAEQITFRGYGFKGPSEWRTTDGYHLGDQSTKSISSKTVFSPTEDIKFKLNYTYIDDVDHIPPVLYSDPRTRVAIPRPGGTFGYYYNGPVSYDFAAPNWGGPTTQLEEPGIRHHENRLSLLYDFKVLGQTISGFAAHNNEHFGEELDGNYYLSGTSPITLPNAFGVATAHTYAGSYFNYDLRDDDTQFELRMSAPSTQPLRYTIGYNYSQIKGHTQLFLLNGVSIYNTNQYGGSFLNPATDNSVFGGLYWDIISPLTLSVEGRYQHEVIDAKTYSTAIATYGTPLTHYSQLYTAFLPRVNLQYKIDKDLQVYAVYSEGNNPGGFQPAAPNLLAPLGIPYAYKEEKIKNYEAGVKSSWLDDRLIVNAAVFHMDFTNEQLSQTVPVPGTPTGFSSLYLPGVSSKVDGFELEADALLARDLQVRATVGYGKAKYKSFCSQPYAALTGIQTGLNCRSVDGFQQEGTPALQTSLSVDYSHEIGGNWALYLRPDWEYQSKVYNEEWDQSWVPAHGIVNARIGIEDHSWTFEGFVRNATDDMNTTRSTRVTDGRGFSTSYPALGGFSQAIAGEQNVAGTAKKPRQFGVRVAYQF